MNRCNRCMLEDAGKLATIQGGFLMIQLRTLDTGGLPPPEPGEPSVTMQGYDIFVVRPGEEPNHVMWLHGLAPACGCS